MEIPNLTEKVIVRGIVICGTCGLPAKTLFFNMNQYNGRFGCQVFKAEGVRINNFRIYPYTKDLMLRTEEEMLHATQAVEMKMKICGVKGPLILSKIIYKFVTSTALDVMHAVFEGMVKIDLYLFNICQSNA